ncbi:MAG: hypothetical protein AB1422_11615 [bacterium]
MSFVWLAKVAVRHAERNFNQMLSQIEGMLTHIPQGNNSQLNPQQQAQIAQMLMQAQTQMHQLDDLARQRYESRVGDLMGMAADAGIDWTPPSY